jgi:Na+-driven multidrug efflux pump
MGGGVGVLTAHLFGAKETKKLGRAVSNAMFLSGTMAVVMFIIANLTCEPILVMLGTKAAYLPGGILYLRITFVGLFASAIYNIGAGVLRSVGDSRTPLYIAMISGLINVILNVIFVLGFGMSVDGVAIATVISQYFSAITVVVLLVKRKSEPYHLTFKGF